MPVYRQVEMMSDELVRTQSFGAKCFLIIGG